MREEVMAVDLQLEREGDIPSFNLWWQGCALAVP